MERPGGLLVRELADGVGDPAPQGLAVVIVPRGEIVGARSRNSAPSMMPIARGHRGSYRGCIRPQWIE
jgi:hypothetical protein